MKKLFQTLMDAEFIRFALVGVINTLVGTGVMFGLYNLAHQSYWLSSAANYVIGSIVSFFLNKYFTFRKASWSWNEVWRFVINILVCYTLAYGIAKPLVRLALTGQTVTVQDNVAMAVGMVLFVFLNYFGQRLFAFRTADQKKPKA